MCCDVVLGLPSPPLRPTPDAVQRHLDLEPMPAAVADARRFLRESLADADSDTQDTAQLLTSELVTNAILHARTAVRVGVVVDGDQALVCVADGLGDAPPLTPQLHSQTRYGGRGLALVAELSDDWGTARYAGGKTVWFRISVARARLDVG